MGQAIEQGSRHLGIREDARPFTEGEIGGDDDRGALARIAWAVLNKGRNFECARTNAMTPRPA